MADQLPESPAAGAHHAGRTRTTLPGILSFVFALLTLAGLITGIMLATNGVHEPATWAAYAAAGASVIAVLLGIVAAIGNLGRGWGVAGVIVGLLANPLLLTPLLGAIGGLWA